MTPRAFAQNRPQDLSGQYLSIIRNVFDFIQRHYVDEVKPELLFEGAMTGMFNSLDDPYSSFLPESEMKDLTDTTQGSFGGVGLYISGKGNTPRPDGKPNFLEVAAPIEDTPGWRAGINPGDFIISINGELTDILTSDEAVARLRGKPGTEVRLIIRRGERLEFPVTLVRANIEVPTVKHDMIGNLGYLKLLTFTPYTIDRCKEAISMFQAVGYRGVILDLRNNYGGRLDSAVEVTNLFIEGGVVVSTKSRIAGENQVFYARAKSAVPSDIPVIVLINRGSASASEIVAGALKDRGRAFLVGEKSYGKGSVQQVYPLDKVGFKITTARYYTPSDVNIDKIGIPPDREVLFPEFTEADAGKLNTIINSNRITEFVEKNPGAGTADIEAFARTLSREFDLDITLLRRLIRNEQNRTTIAPVYDLEYDVQLQEAVKILQEGSFRSLMQTTKNLKTLQEEALREEKFAQAS
jgi:carboxyl-terminal processing protease